MKKTVLILLLPIFLLAQKKETFKLKMPIKDYTTTTKSLVVIDGRQTKEIKGIVFRGNTYSFSFPTENASADIEDWFKGDNKKRDKGNRDIVLYIENLEITNTTKNHELYSVLDMKFSTFLKKEGKYYFLKRYDNAISLNNKEVGGIPNLFVENTQRVLQNLFFETYRTEPSDLAVSIEDLSNYNTILKSEFPLFNENLKDGIYLDYKSFFSQQPTENYKLIKSEKNEVIKAENASGDKIPARKFYIYVENGKAYKNTAIGFLEINKDENGFYVEANEKLLFPDEVKISAFYFIAGGLIGGAVGGIVEGIKADSKQKKALAADRYKIYIDYLNGEYSFVK